LATGFLIYRIVTKLKDSHWGMIASAIYVFNPAIFANSTFWGQTDSLTAFFSLLAVYLVTGKREFCFYLSAVSLAVGTLVKPQAAFVLPAILFLLIKKKLSWARIFTYGLLALGVFIIGFIPFCHESSLLSFIFHRLAVSANQYPYGSVNAYTFWGLFGFWRPDNTVAPLAVIGILLSLLISGFVLIKARQRKGSEFLLMATVFLASFLFLTRMHERHLLPVLAPLAVSAALWPELAGPYVVLSLTYLANLFYSYRWITREFVAIFPPLVNRFFIILNIISLGFILWRAVVARKIKLVLPRLRRASLISWPKANLSPSTLKWLCGLLLLFALMTRLVELGSPKTEYFDEVYHAFTARQILHANPKAWEWWNTPPEGFAYEWTHPPLAKLGMVLGMKIFGENAFGWRIPGALLGVGSVVLVMLIAQLLFKDNFLVFLAGAVFSLDGLPLVMSRVGMNDSYLLFFTLLAIYLFGKQKDFASALAFGLALASKWSAVWAVPVLFVLWLKRKQKFRLGILWFFVLPLGVYLLSYLPMFLSGHDLTTWWEMQKQMWWYHTNLKATHPYTSSWWEWPFLARPIYLYTSEETRGWVARIYAMGHPLVFWFGIISVATGAIQAFLERNKNLALVVFAYLVFFVPWAASPRIMFLYHYLPPLPFLAIASGCFLRRYPKPAFWLLGIGFLFFIYFFPHWAGLKIPLWLDQSYYWFSSWR
jgi:predicted membrane-bound dolichyl-phosphate-mannose-protein mannosyltransferase